MFLARFVPPENATISAMVSGPLKCGVPTLLGTRGVADDGEPVIGLAFEWPTKFAALVGSDAAKKRTNEHRQLDRLRADFRAHGIADPFLDATQQERDPPDFVCVDRETGGTVAVELTQLTFEERVGEQALFDALTREVLTKGKGKLAHLRGHAVWVTFFDQDGSAQKPPRTADGLLAALKAFTPPPHVDRHAPEQIPADEGPVSFAGGELQATRLIGDPGGGFHALMRWELLLSSTGWVRQETAWRQFTDIVKAKDKPENELVVVVAGSPTWNSGLARPADSLLAATVIARAGSDAIPATEHLRRVWLHSWTERAVYELIPGQTGARRLCGAALEEQPLKP